MLETKAKTSYREPRREHLDEKRLSEREAAVGQQTKIVEAKTQASSPPHDKKLRRADVAKGNHAQPAQTITGLSPPKSPCRLTSAAARPVQLQLIQFTMSGHPSKRKSPPPASASPSSKRQRLSPSQAHLPSLGQHSTTNSPHDSLSSLSPTNSHGSSPGSTHQPPLPPPPNAPATNPGDEYGDEDGEGEEEDEDDDMEEVAAGGHHVVSAKTVPSKQPRPLAPATSAKTNGVANRGGGAVAGKGRKGEEALEHAVAAREEVERRRVELKAAPGGGGAGTGGAKGLPGAQVVEPKVKEEEEEVIVVHGEEAEEIAAPVRCV